MRPDVDLAGARPYPNLKVDWIAPAKSAATAMIPALIRATSYGSRNCVDA
jgi:hypothetical protein